MLNQPCLMNVPLRSSLTACCSSACVFITIGPYHATGSSIGLPDTSRKRMPCVAGLHGYLVAGVEHDQRAVAGAAHAPVSRCRPFSFSVSTPNGCDAPENVPEPSNT